jgi:hypothetical protein
MPPKKGTNIPRRRNADVPVLEPSTPPQQTGKAHNPSSGEVFNFAGISASSDDEPRAAHAADVPPVLVSPIKCRQRRAAPGINRLSDIEVWGMTDEEIIGVCHKYI